MVRISSSRVKSLNPEQMQDSLERGSFMAGSFDGGRPARLDARASVRHVHAGQARTVATGTRRVTVQAPWPPCRPALPRGLEISRVAGHVVLHTPGWQAWPVAIAGRSTDTEAERGKGSKPIGRPLACAILAHCDGVPLSEGTRGAALGPGRPTASLYLPGRGYCADRRRGGYWP